MSTNPPAPEPHGQPPAYQQPASPAPGYASAPPPAPAPDAQVKPKGPSTLGLIAFVVALAAIIIGSIIAFIAGQQLGATVGEYGGGSSTVDTTTLPPEAQQALASGAVLAFVAFAVMGVLALWGFIQGIIAAVKNRGRGWAITAIILAVIAFIPVLIFLGIGTGAGAAPYAS